MDEQPVHLLLKEIRTCIKWECDWMPEKWSAKGLFRTPNASRILQTSLWARLVKKKMCVKRCLQLFVLFWRNKKWRY